MTMNFKGLLSMCARNPRCIHARQIGAREWPVSSSTTAYMEIRLAIIRIGSQSGPIGRTNTTECTEHRLINEGVHTETRSRMTPSGIPLRNHIPSYRGPRIHALTEVWPRMQHTLWHSLVVSHPDKTSARWWRYVVGALGVDALAYTSWQGSLPPRAAYLKPCRIPAAAPGAAPALAKQSTPI